MNKSYSKSSWSALRTGRKLIKSEAFVAYLQDRGNAPGTIREYRRRVSGVAYWLVEQNLNLSHLRRGNVTDLLERYLRFGRKDGNFRMHRSALNCWLQFQERFAPDQPAYQKWLNEYLDFLATHRGLAASTRENYGARLRHYLAWQFKAARPDWSKVQAEDVWRYAEHCAHAVKPLTAKGRLGTVRQFLSFVHLRGAGSPHLANAVPKIAMYRTSIARSVLTNVQRSCLLGCFNRRAATGRRDYALTLLMVDLGLRIGEVVRLRLDDVDWQQHLLRVPAIKTGRGRTLPLPRHIAGALRMYLRFSRPSSDDPCLFLRDRVYIGRPLSVGAARINLIQAYRRCGFPSDWGGAHILRRTFATRLYSKGATMRQIADLLGHQQVTTTGVYTQVAIQAMRLLAQPWPVTP